MPQHVAPDLHLGQAYSHGMEIWSAGIALVYTMFGRIPPNGVDFHSVGQVVINEPLRSTQAEMY
ncbi:hypothetical protein OF83DRAFT_1180389 [Amylostereum chailletii]|nr:hypothetical protein OF83DRAFT_1180389 [Amylostereum chailletii]